MGYRTSGRKLAFLDLAPTVEEIRQDRKLQVMVRRDETDDASWAVLENCGLGDWLGVEGSCFLTRAGEPSLLAKRLTMLCKSIRPIPLPKIFDQSDGSVKEFYTLQDGETLARFPELDMLTRRKAETLVARSRILGAIRAVLATEFGCIELETPFLNAFFGGAEATPFTTQLRAYSQEVFLAISPEIELKRALVGGLGSGGRLGRGVYFVARNFRNEGIDRTHNPEFTSVEVYIPFVDYDFMMGVTERVYARACEAVHGTLSCRFRDHDLHFGQAWPRLKMTELVRDASGIDVETLSAQQIRDEIVARQLHLRTPLDGLTPSQMADARPALVALLERSRLAWRYGDLARLAPDELAAIVLRHKLHRGLNVEQEWDFLVLDLFDVYCEHFLMGPCHVILHPAKSTVLCKESRGGLLPNGHALIERFESFGAGMELSNAYSELNDPIVQRRLVEEQAAARAAGKQDAMPHNELFLRAIETGLPPCGGLGIGVDRMTMILTDSATIRDVIAFPMVPAQDGPEAGA
jgi:lysyl-tRNA synthetase class 2